jgi:hypothetical protein
MITNEESAKMKRLTEVMSGTYNICHKLRTKNGVIGVEFDRGLYKGKFMPLYTQYDIEHLKIFIDQTRDEMNKKYNDNDNMIKLDDEYFTTLEPDDIEEDVCEEYDAGELGSLDGHASIISGELLKEHELDVQRDDEDDDEVYLFDDDNLNLSLAGEKITKDILEKSIKDMEGYQRNCIRKKAKKIIDEIVGDWDHFDHIVTYDEEFCYHQSQDNFCGIVCWDPRKSNPHVIKLKNPFLSRDVKDFYNKLRVYARYINDCTHSTVEFKDGEDDNYVKHCMEKEDIDPDNIPSHLDATMAMCMKAETKKIIDDYSEYFDFITSPMDKFCGVVFWNPRKSNPQVIKLKDPIFTGDIGDYDNKLRRCIDIIMEFEDDEADEYAKHCAELENDTVSAKKHCEEEEDTDDYDAENDADKKIQEFVKKSLQNIINYILTCDK